MDFNFAIDERIEDAARNGAVFALNLSGGKDSTMSAHAANRMLDDLGHPRSRRIAIHADLGRAEWRSTNETIKRQAAQLGLQLVVTRRLTGDMIARWEQRFDQGWDLYTQLKLARLRGPWSTANSRFCTAEMKRDVLHRYLASTFPGETIVSVLGIRHAESLRRSRTPISKIDEKLKRANGTNGILWHPSIYISTEDVYRYHKLHGLILHEAYARYHASRLSCAYCVLASQSDLTIATSVTANRDLFHHLVEMEIRTGFSFQQAKWLADIAPHLLSDDQRLRLAAAKVYSTQRRSLESRIDENFLKVPKGTAWPARLPTHEEAVAIAEARRHNASWFGKIIPYLSPLDVKAQLGRMISSS